jgi:hypothetical protein
LEVKGNFTWGLINQQKDQDSEEDQMRLNLKKAGAKDQDSKPENKVNEAGTAR